MGAFYLFSLSSLWDGHLRNNTDGIACSKLFSIPKGIPVRTMDIFDLIGTHNNCLHLECIYIYIYSYIYS